MYGTLTGEQITLKSVGKGKILGGNKIEGYILRNWWNRAS